MRMLVPVMACWILITQPAWSFVQRPEEAAPASAGSGASAVAHESSELREARALHAEAEAARKARDFVSARQHASRAIVLLVDPPSRVVTSEEESLLYALGLTSASLGDAASARRAWARVVEERETRLPEDHPGVTTARSSLANTIAELGDLPGARDMYQRLVSVLERSVPERTSELTRARGNLALTHLKLGELHEARLLQESVLETWTRTADADDLELARARIALAATVLKLGEAGAARELLTLALSVLERTRPNDDPLLGNARSTLALVLKQLGDLPAARVLQERVVETLEEKLPADHPKLMNALSHLALTLRASGEPLLARALLERVLETLELTLPPDHRDVLSARGNLANNLRSAGDFAAARELEETVLETLERVLPAGHADIAAARLNLSSTLRQLGEPRTALALQEHALDELTRSRDAHDPLIAAARHSLALTHGTLLAGTRSENEREDRIRALRVLGEELVRTDTWIVRSMLVDASPREVEERLAHASKALAIVLSLARGFGIADLGSDLRRDAFLLSEWSRAGTLLAARMTAHGGAGDAEFRRRIAEESETLARLAQSGGTAEELDRSRSLLDAAGRDLARYVETTTRSLMESEPTLESLARGLGPGDALIAFRSSILATVQSTDPPKWSDVDSILAFVLRPGVAPSEDGSERAGHRLELVDLGPSAPIRSAVDAWRASTIERRERGLAVVLEDDTGPRTGHAVRALVLDPLREFLGGATRIVVALDDALHAIPLDALPAGPEWSPSRPEALLGDVLRIELRGSLLEDLLPSIEADGPAALLAIGHPAFDAHPTLPREDDEDENLLAVAAPRAPSESSILRGGAFERGFGTLPETRAEVRGVRQYFEDAFGEAMAARVLERRDASREALLAFAPSARWLHVATHGWLAPEAVSSFADAARASVEERGAMRMDATDRLRGLSPMLLCGLALAGANLPADATGRIPGLITAQEIAALDLSNCELAVLSACDTNVGVTRAGQGVASLQRALHMAGARSVITSLWKVPDEATRLLMIEFYRRLWIGKESKHSALWAAKQKLRDARDEQGKALYGLRDWAGWVLTGKQE